MPALHPLGALLTATDGNVEAPHISAPHDLFLILRVHTLDCQRSAAVRALLGRGDLDLLVDVIGNGPVGMGTMGHPRLTPGTLGIRFRLPAGEGSSLPFRGTLRRFQILAQPLVLFLELLILFLEPLILFLKLLVLFGEMLGLFSGAATRISSST